jgi:hypothetical protein
LNKGRTRGLPHLINCTPSTSIVKIPHICSE